MNSEPHTGPAVHAPVYEGEQQKEKWLVPHECQDLERNIQHGAEAQKIKDNSHTPVHKIVDSGHPFHRKTANRLPGFIRLDEFLRWVLIDTRKTPSQYKGYLEISGVL